MTLGPVNLPATMPLHASQMFSRNVLTLLQHLIKDGKPVSTSTTRSRARCASPTPARCGAVHATEALIIGHRDLHARHVPRRRADRPRAADAAHAADVRRQRGQRHHVVGALVIAGSDLGWISNVLGFLAIVLAMMNVVGGYAVTDRMLGMFKARTEEKR